MSTLWFEEESPAQLNVRVVDAVFVDANVNSVCIVCSFAILVVERAAFDALRSGGSQGRQGKLTRGAHAPNSFNQRRVVSYGIAYDLSLTDSIAISLLAVTALITL